MRYRLLLPIIAVCQSVTRSTRLHCAKMTERIKILLVLNTPGGPGNIVLDGGPDTPTARGRVVGKKLPIVDTLHLSRMAEEDWGPQPKLPQIGHTADLSGVTWPTFNLCDPLHDSESSKSKASCACCVLRCIWCSLCQITSAAWYDLHSGHSTSLWANENSAITAKWSIYCVSLTSQKCMNFTGWPQKLHISICLMLNWYSFMKSQPNFIIFTRLTLK